ncbi:MAG: SpoIIE family protein phosphatase [Acidimicrobiales bacterium]
MTIGDGERRDRFSAFVAARVADRRRLAAVEATGLLDTGPEPGFDRLASLAARLLGAPLGFVTVVDDTRSFWKACIGVDPSSAQRQNPVGESFCQYVIGLDDAFLIDDTRKDPRTADNPSIESMGVLAWAGVPLRDGDGEVIGTVCVVDTAPRSWSAADTGLLAQLAEIATDQIRSARTATAAARSEALLTTVLERAPIGFALVDEDLRYELVNEVLAEINGLSIDDHIGRRMSDLLPEVAEVVEPLLRSVLETGEPVLGVEVTGSTPARPGVERTWSASYYRLELDDHARAGLFIEEVTEQVSARRRARRLARITELLARTTTLDDIAAVVGSDVTGYFGAALAVVGLLEAGTGTMKVLTSPEIVRTIEPLLAAADRKTDYGMAARTRQVILVSDARDRELRFPGPPVVGIEASAAVPCLIGDGTVAAVLLVGWARRLERSEFPLPQLKTMASLIAHVVDRNRSSQERVDLVRTLQLSLLGTPASVPAADFAVRYEPAGAALGFGGDWYDVVTIDDARTALVVGDVVGHDPRAAGRMAQIRTVVADLLLLDTPLDALFEQAERLLAVRGDRSFVTVVVVVVDSIRRTLTAVSAGHLPGLIVDPDGSVGILEPALGPPLHAPGARRAVEFLPYRAGTRLVLFTDGLIERRDGTIDDHYDELVDYLASNPDLVVESLADRLVGDFAGRHDRFDDIALITALLH